MLLTSEGGRPCKLELCLDFSPNSFRMEFLILDHCVKDKNKDLTARLSNESGGDNGEFVKNLMRQSAADGEMLRDFTKQCANLESQMTRLKAQNFTLQMR